MKKLIIELIKKYFDQITESWVEKLQHEFGDKLSKIQLKTFVESSLNTIIDVIESANYSHADQYLIDSYQLFTKAKLNLLQISQLFTIGRYAIINYLEKDANHNVDPLILLGFLDEVIEQIYARYGMLHQNAEMQELTSDRDRIAIKLETSQQYLDNILHSSDSAIMVIDNDEKFISWNKGAEAIFGYTEKEVIGKPSSLLFPKGKKYNNELKHIQNEIKENGYVTIDETERLTKDGKIVTIQLTVTKLPGNNGEESGRTVIIRDYTEVKKLQQQVDQSEKLAVIGQLAAGIAHEIGNPLTSISAIVQILQRKSPDDFFSEQLSTIKENIDRISRIVRELVDFSRPPSHEKTLIEITDIVKTAIGIVKYDKRVKKVDFNTDLDKDSPPIMVVPDQLLQVFVNILIQRTRCS
ncbi:MAG: PAS domain S-box protein [Melioribacteraceae bacterium]|nr:PAS domain S-box protein [Melioribacteraceae bacterium]